MRDLIPGKGLHEHVGRYAIGGYVVNVDKSPLYNVANKVVSDVNVLCPGVIFIILGDSNCRDIVEVYGDKSREGPRDFSKEHA